MFEELKNPGLAGISWIPASGGLPPFDKMVRNPPAAASIERASTPTYPNTPGMDRYGMSILEY